MSDHGKRTAATPALFRAGDIGVSSEWRDITYDWAPVLTADGVFIYSYLRDMFDNQRILRPFILNPDGPTKQRIQRVLGRRTGWAIRGPEYLLATVGLVHVEVQYGVSSDEDRPRHTATAYYVVGRLDHPVLDWSMIERVLDALLPALEPLSSDPQLAARQKDAEAALRSLGQAGMLQNVDPDDLFDPDGAWPGLLPALLQDERWQRLFTYLHTIDALQPYRRQARAWVEWAQRRAERAMRENRAIADQLLAAQRKGQRGGGPTNPPTSNGGPMGGPSRINNSATSQAEGIGMTQVPSVPDVSLACPRGIGVTPIPSGTVSERPHQAAVNEQRQHVPDVSLNQESINVGSTYRREYIPSNPERTAVPGDTDWVRSLDDMPPVARHVRDDELASVRQDTYFWRAVQQIFHGDDGRYDHTDGEKKAARRLANKTGAPVGVMLAALRAVMTLAPPQRPKRFGDALKLDVFHACVQQALALLPARAEAAAAASSWPQFLQAYRRLGQVHSLRDVSASDYHVLHALFATQPDACWDVLNRVEHAAQLPDLTPAYLRRAIVNNQRAVAQQALLPIEPRASCVQSVQGPIQGPSTISEKHLGRSPDPRHVLLEREGLPAVILTDAMSEAYIRQWLTEADARRDEIYSRAGWLKWGIESGCVPAEHPQLSTRSRRSLQFTPNDSSAVLSGAGPPLPDPPAEPELLRLWQSALAVLEVQLPSDEFETWVKPCHLVALDPGASRNVATRAIVAAPNIFVRQELETTYHSIITAALGTKLDVNVEVQCVIAARP